MAHHSADLACAKVVGGGHEIKHSQLFEAAKGVDERIDIISEGVISICLELE